MRTTDKPDIRRIELNGAYNFEDVAGYETTQSMKTHWGKLFRSDNLAKPAESDFKQIEKLNLQLVIDLRSKTKRLQLGYSHSTPGINNKAGL